MEGPFPPRVVFSFGVLRLLKSLPPFNQFTKLMLDRAFADLCKQDKTLSTKENDFKLQVIQRLVKKKILDYPTSGNLADWLDIQLNDLHFTEHYGEKIGTKYKRLYVETPVAQQCHAISALYWILNPNLELYTGFADKTHFHSWLIDGKEKTLLEPTPVERGSYFGYKSRDPIDFALREVNNICRLAEKRLIPKAVYEKYQLNLQGLLAR